MKNQVTIIGSKSMNARLALLLRNTMDLEVDKIALSNNIQKYIDNVKDKVVVLAVGPRSVANACQALEQINAANANAQIIILSEVKDPDLMFTAMKLDIRQFILDSRDDTQLIKALRKELNIASEARPKMSVLCIGAHPDDVEIGVGGTLKKHRQKGDKVTILTLTGGAFGGKVGERQKESENAAKFLDAKLIMGDLNDTEVSEGPETIGLIQQAIKDCKPDIIYTHSANDTHKDHRATHQATMVAARGINKVYAYLAPSGTIEFSPRYFEHVEDFMDDKMTAINCFTSQTIGCRRPYLKDSIIRSTAEYWGRFSGYGMVEPFEVIRA